MRALSETREQRRGWFIGIGLVLSGLLLAACGTDVAAPEPADETPEAPDEAPEPDEQPEPDEPAPDEDPDEPAPDEGPEELVDVAIATAAAIDHTGTFAAIENGFFEQYGLDATTESYATGVEIISALSAGEVDFGVLGVAPAMAARSRGVPVVIIGNNHGDASLGYTDGVTGIVAGPDSGVPQDGIAELRGKRIGVPVGAVPEVFLYTVLATEGMTADDVTVVNVAPADTLSALEQGSIDAYSLFEPWVSRGLESIPGSVVVCQGCLSPPEWYSNGIIVAEESFVEENPEVVEDFLTAMAASHQWIRNNTSDAAEVATRWVPGLEPEVAERALGNIAFDLRITDRYPEPLGFMKDFLLDQGTLEDPDLEPMDMVSASHATSVVRDHPELFDDVGSVPDDSLVS